MCKDSNLGKLKLRVGPELKAKLIGQLRRDVWFLQVWCTQNYHTLASEFTKNKMPPRSDTVAMSHLSYAP